MRATMFTLKYVESLKDSKPFLYKVLTGTPADVQAALRDPATDLLEEVGERHTRAFALVVPRMKGVGPDGREMNPEDQEIIKALIAHPGIEIGADAGDSVGFAPLDYMCRNQSPYYDETRDLLLKRNAEIALPMRATIEKAFDATSNELLDVRASSFRTEEQARVRINHRAVKLAHEKEKAGEGSFHEFYIESLAEVKDRVAMEDVACEEQLHDVALNLSEALTASLDKLYRGVAPSGRSVACIRPEPFAAAAKIGERDKKDVERFAAYHTTDRLFYMTLTNTLDAMVGAERESILRVVTKDRLYELGNKIIRDTIGFSDIRTFARNGYFRPHPV